MEITMQTVLLGSAIIFFSFFTRSMFGFGGALISIPLLAFIMPLKIAVPLEAIFEVLSGLMLIRAEYPHINRKVLWPMVIGAMIGSVIGVVLLKSFADTILLKILGAVVIVFSLNLLRKQALEALHLPRIVGVGAGLTGGILGGMFGTSGPPYVLYLTYTLIEKHVLRATLIGLFMIDYVFRLGVFVFTGLVTKDILMMALYLLPAFVIGTLLGKVSFKSINERTYRLGVVGLLILTGVLLLMR